MDATLRFSGRAQYYARSRPGYPDAVVEFLRRHGDLPAGSRVADIGSGTGISCELLLRHGFEVYGVEPNLAMRNEAEDWLGEDSKFHSVDGRAESTTLPEGSVDLVTAMQAFHWFDPGSARREFLRILRPGGRVALVWNRRRTEGSAFLAAYEQLLLEISTDYREGWGKERRKPEAWSEALFGHGECASASFEHHRQIGLQDFIGGLMSASYAPLPGDPNHQLAVKRATEIFEAHQSNGAVTLEYDTVVYDGALA